MLFINYFLGLLILVKAQKSASYLQNRHNKIGANYDDRFKDISEIVRENGYKFEEHKVITEDGYILKLHRIPPSTLDY
jgi:hypothetical protein